MHIRITVEAGSSDSLVRDLHEWLSADRDAWVTAHLSESAPIPGALGPVADAVVLVLSSVGSLSSLAGVIVAWLQYRKPDTVLKIVIDDQRNPVQIGSVQALTDPDSVRRELAVQLAEAAAETGQGDAG
jgi:hypothetical protein